MPTIFNKFAVKSTLLEQIIKTSHQGNWLAWRVANYFLLKLRQSQQSVNMVIHGTTVSIHLSLDVKRNATPLINFIPYLCPRPKSASRFDLRSLWLLMYLPLNIRQAFASIIDPLLEASFLNDCFSLDESKKSRCLLHKNGVAWYWMVYASVKTVISWSTWKQIKNIDK